MYLKELSSIFIHEVFTFIILIQAKNVLLQNATENYITTETELDAVERNIWQGRPAKLGEIPYQAAMIQSNDKKVRCGGIIISSKHVLTAGHCFLDSDNTTSFYIKAGMVYHDDKWGIIRSVDWFARPDYFLQIKHDIGLIKVKDKFIFKVGIISAIPISWRPIRKGELCQASGWGFEDVMDINGSERLLVTKMRTTCCPSNLYHRFDGGICAFRPGATCNGDSGGPFVCRGELVGIITGSAYTLKNECSQPSFITEIKKHKEWLIKKGVEEISETENTTNTSNISVKIESFNNYTIKLIKTKRVKNH